MNLIPYGRQCIDKKDIAAVVKVLKSDWITQGPKIKEFEEALSAYTGAKYAVVVSSGTAALHIACLAVGLEKGDEAITTPITFLATANSVLHTGARPVFADINRQTANISTEEVKRKITKRTKAVLPVHFAGLPYDILQISRIARKYNLAIIEDACHALGAKYKFRGRWYKVGSCKHSDMAVFSFHPVKSITTGEGGAVTTNNKNLYKKLCALRSHGVYKTSEMMRKKDLWYYEMRHGGFNYRITDIQCALGIAQLKKIDRFINRRREIAALYNKKLSKIEKIDLPVENENVKSAWHLYSIRIRGRSNVENMRRKIFVYLRKKGIGAQVHYIPINSQYYYRRLGYQKKACPNAHDFYHREISIPIFPALKNSELIYVISILNDIFKNYEE